MRGFSEKISDVTDAEGRRWKVKEFFARAGYLCYNDSENKVWAVTDGG